MSAFPFYSPSYTRQETVVLIATIFNFCAACLYSSSHFRFEKKISAHNCDAVSIPWLTCRQLAIWWMPLGNIASFIDQEQSPRMVDNTSIILMHWLGKINRLIINKYVCLSS